jgi:integrase
MHDLDVIKTTRELIEFDQIPENPVVSYLAELSEGSRPGQLIALRAALGAISGQDTEDVLNAEVAAFEWHKLRSHHVSAIRAALQDQHSPAYANKILSVVRGVLRAAWRMGLMSHENYARAADVRTVRGERLPAGRDLSHGEISALIRVCSDDLSPAGPRDAALIGLGVTCGPRISEVSNLDLQDYDPDDYRLLLKGKGSKERAAYLVDGVKEAMEDWLDLRGLAPGPLFNPVLKGGRLRIRHLGITSLMKMLEKRSKQAGVKPFTWHDMRRTAAGDLLDAGVDLATVQKVLGHADPRTTARYERRPEEAKREGLSRLHVPYERRRLF